MSLTPGTRIGPYEVVGKIGEGGMGEVYRATDTKLKRDAALKVLPESLTADPDRRARFTREAQVLASLNHPNIAGIYGLEQGPAEAGHPTGADVGSGFSRTIALAMEFVEGEDLSTIIARGAIPLADALPLARQIAEALEAAHEQGIVHRDLKPQNIKVRADGTVKVLDFGLAKALGPSEGDGFSRRQAEAEASALPTITTPAMTMRGMILGTAAYMSPEQAKGRVVDKRADIWAFGVVLYEMLTGRRVFDGDDTSEVLAAVLRQDIQWSALPAATPPRLKRLLERCLDREHRQRLRDIGEARVEIARIESGAPDASGISAPATSTRGPVPLWRRAGLAVSGVALAALTAGATWTLKPSPLPSTAVTRFAFTPPEGQGFRQAGRRFIAVSPDGSQIAYVANSRIYLRLMDQLQSREIEGTSGQMMEPVFSPDGRAVAFFSTQASATGGAIKRIPIGGGPAVTISQADRPFGLSWETDDTILIGQGGKGIIRVPASGGQAETIVTVKEAEGELAQGPRLLPGGKVVMFTLAKRAPGVGEIWDRAQIVAQSLASGERSVLIDGGHDAMYLPTGHLIYVRSGTLFAVRFDPQRLVVSGTPVPIVEDVAGAGALGASQYSVAGNGSLAFIPGSALPLQQLTWFDRTGKALDTAGGQGRFAGLNLSPDGRRIGVHRHEEAGGDVWVHDGPRSMRLTFEASQENSSPIWSPDGTRIAFQSLRNGKWGVYQKNADGTGAEELLTESEWIKWPSAWTPDGRSILYVVVDPKTNHDVWLLPLTGDRQPTPLLNSPSVEYFAQVSPDGRWLVYSTNEGGTNQVFVKPFPTGSGRWLVSGNGIADFPRWRGDGKELFYLTSAIRGTVMSVAVNASGASFVAETPAALFTPPGQFGGSFGHLGNFFIYAVSPDGQRFLMPQPVAGPGGASAPTINVILNWTSLLPK